MCSLWQIYYFYFEFKIETQIEQITFCPEIILAFIYDEGFVFVELDESSVYDIF